MHGHAAEWGATEHLLAATVDRLGLLIWAQGRGKGTRPTPIPRPGTAADPRTRRLGLTDAQLAARLLEQRARTRREE